MGVISHAPPIPAGALSLPTDTVWVSGDEVRIQQVLVNVLANALDACSHDAAIAVTWQTQERRWRFILQITAWLACGAVALFTQAVYHQ